MKMKNWENENFVLIEESKLLKLFESDFKLHALERDGVNNWTWYDDALNGYLRSECEDSFESLARSYLEENYKVVSLDVDRVDEKSK